MTLNVQSLASSPRRRRGPSPLEGERVRPLSRGQVEDRWQELGDLYAETSGVGPGQWARSRTAFLRRLAVDVRQPGFGLLIAEAVVRDETSVLTGCAYGFPVRVDGPWWQGLDGCLPRPLLSLAASGGLFAVSGILVPERVRAYDQDREWNLARRLQKRLLTDHDGALGVFLVDRGDTGTLDALRSWGWRSVAAEPRDDGLLGVPSGPRRALVVDP
ncbi:hypothetical protein AB0H86_04925 [Streptomyces sp. NPDC050997]|uniref:hypothetical protein n=1 Tax=Streptomyces sp. NPDC050997 TaxID=3155519 RepID=UPI00343EB71F